MTRPLVLLLLTASLMWAGDPPPATPTPTIAVFDLDRISKEANFSKEQREAVTKLKSLAQGKMEELTKKNRDLKKKLGQEIVGSPEYREKLLEIERLQAEAKIQERFFSTEVQQLLFRWEILTQILVRQYLNDYLKEKGKHILMVMPVRTISGILDDWREFSSGSANTLLNSFYYQRPWAWQNSIDITTDLIAWINGHPKSVPDDVRQLLRDLMPKIEGDPSSAREVEPAPSPNIPTANPTPAATAPASRALIDPEAKEVPKSGGAP